MKKNFHARIDAVLHQLDLWLRPYQYIRWGTIILTSPVTKNPDGFVNALDIGNDKIIAYPLRQHRVTKVVQGYLPSLHLNAHGLPFEDYSWKDLESPYQEEAKGKIDRSELVEIIIDLNNAYAA